MADQIRTRGSTRIKTADPAGAKYRGSATSGQFAPVKAASTQTRHKERKAQLSQDLDAQSRELSRTQTSANLLLRLRQGAQTGKLKAIQLQESNALKLDQTQEAGQFNIDKSVALANAALNTSGVSAQGQVSSGNFKAISSIAQMSLKFAETWHTAIQANQQATDVSIATFRSPDSVLEKGQKENEEFNASQVASQKAAEKVSNGDQALEQLINEDAKEALRTRQGRKLAINEVSGTMYPYVASFMASGEVLENTPFGPLAPNQASGADQITYMVRLALHRWGVENNLGLMIKADPVQVEKVLVKQANAVKQQLLNGLIQQDITGKINNAKSEAVTAALSDLDAGVNAAEVVQNLYTANVASGGYRGNPSGASDDAVKSVLDYAVKTRNEDIINQLEEGYKIKGNKGLQWKKIKASEILDARRRLDDGEIADGNREITTARQKRFNILEERLKALDKENITNEEEVKINADTIQKLEALGDYEALREATKLRNKGLNYNPFLYSELKSAQIDSDNPIEYSNEELHDWYNNQDITLEEAKSLGYQPIKGVSKDSVAKAKLKDWKIDTSSVAKGIVNSVLSTKISDATVRNEVVKTQGINIANDIERRLNADMFSWLRDNPSAAPSEAAAYLQELTEQYVKIIQPKMDYDNNTGIISGYDFGGTSPMKWELPPPLKRADGTIYHNYSTQPIEQLEKLGVAQFNPTKHQILTVEELDLGWKAINGEEGINIPKTVSEKANALGISITDLIIMQAQFHPGYEGASTLPVGGLPTQSKE